jgi:hypothetical protein
LALSRQPVRGHKGPDNRLVQAAAVAVCHARVASDRKVRSVWREIRRGLRLNVLWTAACIERKRWAERADLYQVSLISTGEPSPGVRWIRPAQRRPDPNESPLQRLGIKALLLA